jgi:hypothetical protein
MNKTPKPAVLILQINFILETEELRLTGKVHIGLYTISLVQVSRYIAVRQRYSLRHVESNIGFKLLAARV